MIVGWSNDERTIGWTVGSHASTCPYLIAWRPVEYPLLGRFQELSINLGPFAAWFCNVLGSCP